MWVFLGGIVAAGCKPNETKKQYLARVGDSYLTQEDLTAAGDSTILSSEARRRELVARWVNNEVLFQEARKQGMESSELVQQQLRETRKQLSIQAFLQKEIYGDSLAIPEDSIQAYYDSHPADFLQQEEVVRLNLIAFANMNSALAFRSKVLRGTSWDAAIDEALSDSATLASIVRRADTQNYSKQTLSPPELWRVATSTSRGTVSYPVKTASGFFLLQPIALSQQGRRARLDIVQDEIRQRMILEKRRQQYAQLLSRLRSQYELEVEVP